MTGVFSLVLFWGWALGVSCASLKQPVSSNVIARKREARYLFGVAGVDKERVVGEIPTVRG